MLFINVLQVMEIVRALGVYTFVDNKVFPVFLVNQGVAAVWAAKNILFGKTVLIGREVGVADLTFDLAFFTVIPVKIGLWGITGGALAVFRDIAFLTA